MSKVIVICGPTASGKSALALKLAENIKDQNPVIINADSMQLYKDIEVIAASPSLQDKDLVPHKLYGILGAQDYCSVADYVQIAAQAIEEVLQSGGLPIVVGGTGMYINALMFGYSPIPDIDPKLRFQAREKLALQGNHIFYEELARLDPLAAAKLNPGDSQRILRAYEVIKQSGKSILEYHAAPPIKPLPDCQFKVIMLSPERNFLYNSCNERFYNLLDKGAAKEVKSLIEQGLSSELQIFKALGVKEIAEHLIGNISLKEAINMAQTKTRQYAKRQVTWFTHQVKEKEVINYDNFVELWSLLKDIKL